MGILIIIIIATLVIAAAGAGVYVFIFRAQHKKEVLENSKLNDMGAGYLGATGGEAVNGNSFNPSYADNSQAQSQPDYASPMMNDISAGASQLDASVPPVPQPPEMQASEPEMTQPDANQSMTEPTVSEMGQNLQEEAMSVPSFDANPAEQTSPMESAQSEPAAPASSYDIPPVQDEEVPSSEPALDTVAPIADSIPETNVSQEETVEPENNTGPETPLEIPQEDSQPMSQTPEEVNIPVQTEAPAQPEPMVPEEISVPVQTPSEPVSMDSTPNEVAEPAAVQPEVPVQPEAPVMDTIQSQPAPAEAPATSAQDVLNQTSTTEPDKEVEDLKI